jgi:hypothetical protein
MGANDFLPSPWNDGGEIPIPIRYNRKTMPPGPHFMYFNSDGREFKFYNWFTCLRDLMEHYIVSHLVVKPYFGCPYPRCYKTLSTNTDELANPVHGHTKPEDKGEDSCWFKKQILLKRHLTKVHDCKFDKLGRRALYNAYI